jgi:hypothetical protein
VVCMVCFSIDLVFLLFIYCCFFRIKYGVLGVYFHINVAELCFFVVHDGNLPKVSRGCERTFIRVFGRNIYNLV